MTRPFRIYAVQHILLFFAYLKMVMMGLENNIFEFLLMWVFILKVFLIDKRFFIARQVTDFKADFVCKKP